MKNKWNIINRKNHGEYYYVIISNNESNIEIEHRSDKICEQLAQSICDAMNKTTNPLEGDIYKIAETILKQDKDFKEEGLSEYMNGKLNGIIEGLQYASIRKEGEAVRFAEWLVKQGFSLHDKTIEGFLWSKDSDKPTTTNDLYNKYKESI
jgi:hypothetical protein